MMKIPILMILLFCSAALMAFEDLGSLETAQKKYPQIFEMGSINIININDVPCYVFSGEAEQAFAGDYAEPESELYEEATLSAKSNFYETLSKKNKQAVVTMTGSGVLYQYNDKKLYRVILFVPRANVSIKPNDFAAVAAAQKEPGAVQNVPAVAATKPAAVPALPVAAVVDATLAKSPAEAIAVQMPSALTTPKEEAPKLSATERRIAKFKSRIDSDPDNIFALVSLADLYNKSKAYKEALKYYRLAVQKIDQGKFYDEAEKIRIISEITHVAEQNKNYNIALKYNYYLLRHKCSMDQRKKAVAAISRLRLRTLD